MAFGISLRKSRNKKAFRAAPNRGESLIDTSYSGNDNGIGHLRMPAVGNAQYDWRHPIFDEKNNKIGALANGDYSIGYTWCCVYVNRAGCFFLNNCYVGSHEASYVSVVENTGSFLFAWNQRKFKKVHSITYPDDWAPYTLVFKLINEQRHLLYVTNYGFSLIDTVRRESVFTKVFSQGRCGDSAFALSPKVNLLAVAFSEFEGRDPVDGKSYYRNRVDLYDFETGDTRATFDLESEANSLWRVLFSEDGRQIQVSSKEKAVVLDLVTERG